MREFLRFLLGLGLLLVVVCAKADWVVDGEAVGDAEADPVFAADGALQADLVAASNKADTAYSWGDHGTNGYVDSESDPVFAATGALQVDLAAASNKADMAYGWGDHNRLYLNLNEPLVYDAEGSNLHFQVEWSGSADFSSATAYSTSSSQANWSYFNGTQYAAFPSAGIPDTAYGTDGLASVIFNPTDVVAGPVYIRARAHDGADWSNYRVAYGIGAVRLGN